ncbi:MAG TPA: hypothetical protein VF065_18120 [Ilumatobacter sp.]
MAATSSSREGWGTGLCANVNPFGSRFCPLDSHRVSSAWKGVIHMQLFSRQVQLTGPIAETSAYAADMTAHVTGLIGREVSLWSTVFGAPLGTMTYTLRVDGVADVLAIAAQVQADAEFHAKLAKGADYAVGDAQDRLFQPLNAEFGDPPPVGSIALVTSAVIANGAYDKAFAWGIDMAQHASSVAGIPTLFVAEQFGSFGSVGWIGVAADGAAIDAGTAALNADADYLKKLGAAGDLFLPGSGHRILSTRVA